MPLGLPLFIEKPLFDKLEGDFLLNSINEKNIISYVDQFNIVSLMKSDTRLAEMVSSHLANNYETHNYAITLEEAQFPLRLAVDDLNDLAEWQQIQPIYDGIQDGVQYECIAQAESPAEADAKGGKK